MTSIRNPSAVSTPGLLICAFLAGLVMHAAPLQSEMQVYRVESTSPVTLTLPVGEGATAPQLRLPDGSWVKLAGKCKEGKLTLSLDAETLGAGSALLVFNAPRGIDLSDQDPPAVTAISVDRRPVKDSPEIDLGWVSHLPDTITLQVQDEKNRINPGTLRASVDGARVPASENSIKLSEQNQHATLTVPAGHHFAPGVIFHSVTISVDDYAIDDAALTRTIKLAKVPPFQLKDGTRIEVESLTDSPGWRHWEVVADGKVMDSSMKTTAGHTWMSAKHGGAHWIQFAFPESRSAHQVTLSWAYWQVYRTSVAYDIQGWDGTTWKTLKKVENQEERQTSVHTFPAFNTTRLRVWQPPLKGHPDRAELLWLSEAEVK